MDPIEDIEDALAIQFPPSDLLRLEDSRRLTGPGLLWDHPGAVVQIEFDDFNTNHIIAAWSKHARHLLDAVGWDDQTLTHRAFDGGINLAISAPMDQLYSAVFVAEATWHFCACELLSVPPGDFTAMIADLKLVMAREENPALIALLQEGKNRGLDVLCDDDDLSIGHGITSQTWPVTALPKPEDVNWPALGNIPLTLITGTNGKTTTTRLLAAIGRVGGKVSGLTSTDYVRVGDDVLEQGDYSGPGGARLLLRDQRLELACLEVARGGILRRGLPTRAARAAIVTNVAADHLGQYGVNTLPELARAKMAVFRGLAPGGVLILNADDPLVMAEAAQTNAPVWWFSQSRDTAQIARARAAQTPCAWVENDQITIFDGRNSAQIVAIADIPITLNGAARYNIANALAAALAARALGLSDIAIHAGLSGFRNDPTDNPGRFNEFSVNGARVFVDFAHNPHSVAAVAQTLSAIPAKRRMILLSHAGDRSNSDIIELTKTALTLMPDVVVATELLDYLRGRSAGKIPDIIKQTCIEHGLENDQILAASSPLDATTQILDLVGPGDIALLLVLSERDEVFDLLAQKST